MTEDEKLRLRDCIRAMDADGRGVLVTDGFARLTAEVPPGVVRVETVDLKLARGL